MADSPAGVQQEAASSGAASRADGRRGSIRPFVRADIPRVCEIFATAFRAGRTLRRDELAASLEAIFLTSPAYHPDRGSIVHVDALGRVDGFYGVINMTMRLGERRLNGGILCAVMAEDPDRDPTVGATLGRTMQNGRLDMAVSDTANRRSLDMARAFRFTVLPLQSLEWIKVLRPVGTVAYLLCKRWPRAGSRAASAGAALDAILPRWPATAIDARSIRGTVDRAIDVSAFVAAAPGFLSGYALRPAWDADELTWLMTQAARQTRHGTLHVREVLDRGGERAGLYVLYARRGGVAYALQVLSRPRREEIVIGNLIACAAAMGAVAVRGAASREAVFGLLRQRGVLYRHVMSTVVWAGDPDIAAAVAAGDVFVGGLAGETWTKIFADTFA